MSEVAGGKPNFDNDSNDEATFYCANRRSAKEQFMKVHGRFNLVLERDDACDMVHVTHTGTQDRTLFISKPTERHTQVTRLLAKSTVPQLERKVVEGNQEVYKVPLQAKPLINERLFPERSSTDTYVSDRELFHDLGSLWRRVHNETGHLPKDMILSSTGMIEFSPDKQRLFPIPPYTDWKEYSDLPEAREHFHDQVAKELQDVYPYTPIQDLIEASAEGFSRE